MDLSNLGGLGDLAKQMQDAYGEGADVMNQAGKEVAKDMDPDHEIKVHIELSANVEGHDYHVDANITFAIELEPVLQTADSPMGDLSDALDSLDVDLGDDKDAVMEQLGQPRAIGVVKKIETNKLDLSNDTGSVKAELNKDGTLLATIKDDKMLINFESVLSFPEHTDVYVAIPSMEEMQKHILVDLKKIESPVTFSWKEKDKDHLSVSGTLTFNKL